MGQVTPNAAGMLAKFYTSNKNLVVNKPMEVSSYDQPIEVAEDARMFEEEKYWDTLRHEPLSETGEKRLPDDRHVEEYPGDQNLYRHHQIMIDGYYDVGKVDIGPYIGVLAYNNIEGLRLQGGFRTNEKFSKHWMFGTQLGYGFTDQRVKYSAFVQNILSRRRWTTLTVRVRSDIARIGIDDENLAITRFSLRRHDGEFSEEDITLMRRG